MHHVAHNLGNMTRRSIKIDNLRIETVPINRLRACSDNPEAEAVGIYLLINGDLSGEAILILCPDQAMNLADSLLEARPGATARLNELECSALSEFGNLALSSFLNAVADLTRVPLRLSTPAIVSDTLTVIFEAVAMSALTVSDKVLIIKTDFVDWDDSLKFQFWVLPDFVSQSTGRLRCSKKWGC
jgi:chemotaxis protein CheC